MLIYRAAATSGRALYGPAASSAVVTGSGVNHLVVALHRGSTVAVSVNGEPVVPATTDLIAGGSVGLSVTDPASVQGAPTAAGFARLTARVLGVK